MNRILCAACAGGVALGAFATHVAETLTLSAGWNAIYLESTPEDSACEDFFADLPVTKVGAYVSDAYDDTEQYNSDGTERNQKPVSYRLWQRDGRSTLDSLTGGRAYLVLAEEACRKTFYGVPQAPRFTWRRASATDNETVVNLVGVSLQPAAKPLASAYFKEGPYGPKGAVYQVSGTGENPVFKAPFSTSSAKVEPGRAYGVTAAASGRWPGVIALSSTAVDGGVFFEAGANKADIRVTNAGTAARTVRVTYQKGEKPSDRLLPLQRSVTKEKAIGASWTNVAAGASWEIALEPGASSDLVFGIERASLEKDANLGGVLVFEDLGGTQMRVRVPVRVAFAEASAEAAAYPTGLWIGKFLFTHVTHDDSTDPVAAEGMLGPTVLLFVDKNRQMTLLQRVSLAAETNGTLHVMKSHDAARAVSASARRLSSLFVDPANQLVPARRGGFGEETVFSYTVEPTSAGNPFRHVWHPDHDGRNATFDGEAKPGSELWAVTNTVTVQFRDLGTGSPYYSSDVDEIRAGRVLWTVEGLRNCPITAEGTFSIRRLVPTANLE